MPSICCCAAPACPTATMRSPAMAMSARSSRSGRRARETIDLGARLVTPGLVESHIHLDKALLNDRVTATAGTLEEAIRVTGQAKRAFTVDDITSRARRVLDLAVRAGTTAMRSHVEVDPIVGLS